MGTLQPGREADLVIWNGDSLELTTWAEQVMTVRRAPLAGSLRSALPCTSLFLYEERSASNAAQTAPATHTVGRRLV